MFKKFLLKEVKIGVQAVKKSGISASFSYLYHHFRKGMGVFVRSFYREIKEINFLTPLDGKKQKTLSGLHQLISNMKFSIVIVVNDANNKTLIKTIESAFWQTTPSLEVILCGNHEFSELLKRFPNLQVNKEPTGDYVILLRENEVFRADLTYRYEQLLKANDTSRAFHASSVDLDQKGRIKAGTMNIPPATFNFPYEFSGKEVYGLMVPRSLWKKDLTLDWLDLQGIQFQAIPLPLVGSWKKEIPSISIEHKEEYFKAKGLIWEVKEGLLPNTIKAAPSMKTTPFIQVIIPYKESKDLTLKAAKSALDSIGVKVHVTAVDNGSEDLSIAKSLQELGCEVIRVDEPFNYSRLNNLAVKNTTANCPILLFLNNDAVLDPHAIKEMALWVDQPGIGLVGCRLHYPNGLVQHAGVHIFQENARPGSVGWSHIEMGKTIEETTLGRTLHIADAVTAASAMVEKSKFLEVGGFDEVLYPIAYSDTDLALKLSKKGLKSLYTPYAFGTHYESYSRDPGFLEDFDRSFFLQNISKL